MKRWPFIFLAVLAALLFGENHEAMAFVTSHFGNLTNNIEGGGSRYTYAINRIQAVRTAFGYTNLYDLCGNMIVRHGGLTNAEALTYDPENRLSAIAQAGVFSDEFGYAFDGARLWKRLNQNPTNIKVWIGNIYEEKGGKRLFHVFAGGEQVCTFETNSVLYGGSVTTNVGYYYHQDSLNTSSALSGSGGTQLEVDVYYPFGRPQNTNVQASFQVSRRFTGQVFDAESGLYYYGSSSGPYGRPYDLELGGFIQPDDRIPDLWNPQSYNRYSYCLNNPLRYTDPTGHAPLLFDSEAWGQLLSPVKNFFIGGQSTVNNERIMLAQEGIQQYTPLTDANGNKLGNPAGAVVKAGGGALLQAGMMLTPAGEEGLVVKEGSTILKNAAQGKAFEGEVQKTLEATKETTAPQITLETQSGIKTRVDFATKDTEGQIGLTEAKSSATAPLTPNQAKAFPEIEKTGATVKGEGKPGFAGGTQIPPTKVDIVRPNQQP